MRFVESFSTALVSVLLATSALGQFAQVIRSNDGLVLSPRVNKQASDIGPDPGAKNYKEYSTKYCSKPVKKGGKRDLEQRGLEARAKPDNFDEVPMGKSFSRKASGKGLWSGGFGTCVGIIVTGTPQKPGEISRFLFHLTLGSSWEDIRKPWYSFVEDVENAKMSHMKGWIYTPDTSPNAADVRGNEYMLTMAKELEKDYKRLQEKLQYLVGHGTVIRKTHSFSKVGEIQVGSDNKVKVDGHDA